MLGDVNYNMLNNEINHYFLYLIYYGTVSMQQTLKFKFVYAMVESYNNKNVLHIC